MTTSLTIDPTTGETTEITQEPLKVTVSYSRKVGLPNYSNEEASVFWQADVQLDATEEQRITAANDALRAAKSLVYETLGLTFTLDETGAARETLERTFGQVATETFSNNPARKSDGARSDVSRTDCPWAGMTGAAAKKLQWEDLAANPGNWYDNRTNKKNPKGCDFKHSNKDWDSGLWTTWNGKSIVPEDIDLDSLKFKNSVRQT